jgi:hypothetical protein
MDFFTRFALFHKSKVTISQMPAHQNLINPHIYKTFRFGKFTKPNLYHDSLDFSEHLLRTGFFIDKLYYFFTTQKLDYVTNDIDCLLEFLSTPGDVQSYFTVKDIKTSFTARQSVLIHGIWGKGTFISGTKTNITLYSQMLGLGTDSCKDALVAFNKFSEGKISQSEWTFWQKDLICIYKSISSNSEQNEIKAFVDKLHLRNPIIQWEDITERLK